MNKNEIQILVVDDVSENLQVVGNILSAVGYNINFATSGEDALDIVAELKPDLILLDINMPGVDGFEVCRQIKSNMELNHIPIIFLTAKAEIDTIVKGFEIGAADYITKPFNPAELMARVRVHAELKISMDTIQRQHQELYKKNRELEELSETKNKLFSIIAHDLKSPFNTILGFLKLITFNSEKYSKEKMVNQLGIVLEVAQSTFNLLENLLHWRMTLDEGITFKLSACNLNDLLDEVFESTEIIAKGKKIQLTKNCPDNIVVNAEVNMLKTVLRNLISNAIKFTSEFGEVTVFCTENGKEILISVKDNGVGMDQQQINELFSSARNKSTTGTDHEIGTGLGLIICKDFIDKQGGTLSIESEVNKGSTFTIRFPK